MRQMLMNLLVGFPTFLAFGYSLTFFGGIMSYSAFYHMYPDLNTATTTGSLKDHNSLIQGTCNGASNLGGIVGCLSVMYLGNKLGRRLNTFIGAVLCVIGTVLFCSAYSMAQMILGRGKFMFPCSRGANN
jgi:MFS family permease